MNGIDMKKYVMPNQPYVFVFWFFSKAAESYRLSAGQDMVTKSMEALSGLGAVITENPLPCFNLHDFLFGIAAAVTIRIAVYFRGKNAKKYRHGTEYGSARWGNTNDIKPFIDPKFQISK